MLEWNSFGGPKIFPQRTTVVPCRHEGCCRYHGQSNVARLCVREGLGVHALAITRSRLGCCECINVLLRLSGVESRRSHPQHVQFLRPMLWLDGGVVLVSYSNVVYRLDVVWHASYSALNAGCNDFLSMSMPRLFSPDAG